MQLTPEQHDIINHVKTFPQDYTLVNSVAGSGKTTLLTAIASAIQPTRALYLAYNKSIATEASRKFPRSVLCLTTHSLAYRATIGGDYPFTLGTITYRDLPDTIDYEVRLALIETLRAFFLSSYTSFEAYAKDQGLSEENTAALQNLISDMESGSAKCSHDFYLKYFHILLSKNLITYEPFDFIALDEAGDVNPVTLAIVDLLPAKTKILVGDSRQNIYAFNHTINCFSVAKGTHFNMSQSFRVSPEIAERVEAFCHTYISPTMSFIGTPQAGPIQTKAFIARTNAYLIAKMMELNSLGVPYTLVRSADDIFKLARCLSSLSINTRYLPSDFHFLMEDIETFASNYNLVREYRSLLNYLSHVYRNDVAISSTIKLILRYKSSGIHNCYDEAKRHERLTTNFLLGTAHSFKGLEADEVYIADDLNSIVAPIQMSMQLNNLSYEHLEVEDQNELNLYYVACTRARKSLLNATQLTYALPKEE